MAEEHEFHAHAAPEHHEPHAHDVADEQQFETPSNDIKTDRKGMISPSLLAAVEPTAHVVALPRVVPKNELSSKHNAADAHPSFATHFTTPPIPANGDSAQINTSTDEPDAATYPSPVYVPEAVVNLPKANRVRPVAHSLRHKPFVNIRKFGKRAELSLTRVRR